MEVLTEEQILKIMDNAAAMYFNENIPLETRKSFMRGFEASSWGIFNTFACCGKHRENKPYPFIIFSYFTNGKIYNWYDSSDKGKFYYDIRYKDNEEVIREFLYKLIYLRLPQVEYISLLKEAKKLLDLSIYFNIKDSQIVNIIIDHNDKEIINQNLDIRQRSDNKYCWSMQAFEEVKLYGNN